MQEDICWGKLGSFKAKQSHQQALEEGGVSPRYIQRVGGCWALDGLDIWEGRGQTRARPKLAHKQGRCRRREKEERWWNWRRCKHLLGRASNLTGLRRSNANWPFNDENEMFVFQKIHFRPDFLVCILVLYPNNSRDFILSEHTDFCTDGMGMTCNLSTLCVNVRIGNICCFHFYLIYCRFQCKYFFRKTKNQTQNYFQL